MKKLLITAGPTIEPIDPVRYLGNRSSGKLGFAMARAAIERGWDVTVIAGPTSLQFPGDVIHVETTQQMHDAVLGQLPRHDVLIMAAAVADYRPAKVSETKLARDAAMTLQLEPTQDILAAASAARQPGQFVVGFSLEAPLVLDRVRAKLARKGCDVMVANEPATLGGEGINATLVWPDGRTLALGELSKAAFAERLLDQLP